MEPKALVSAAELFAATTAALASFESGGLRIGAGPSWNSIQGDRLTPGGEPVSQSSTRIGFVVDAGVTMPSHSRFFFDIGAQFRYVGTVLVGPFQGVGGGGATMPPTRVPFSHTVIGFALGLRL